ncbi:MAG: tetratricopeptide repeat protein [Bacteroidales bacterium]|nr:tetratricopeptide repeat protein [Bacteroidales bacterium]
MSNNFVKILTLLLIFLIFYSINSAQWKRYFRCGEKYFNNNNYYAALECYKKAAEVQPNIHIAYKLAEAARLCKLYVLSEKWYKYVIENNGTKKYPDVIFWYAEVNKMLGNYQKAQLFFKKYASLNSQKKDYKVKKSIHEIVSCERALFMQFEPKNFNIIKCDDLNSKYSEFQCMQLNDSTLIFTSYKPLENEDTINFYSKIFFYDIKEKRIYVDSSLIVGKHISSFAINRKNDLLIVSICSYRNGEYFCKLYKSKKVNNKWSYPEMLDNIINVPGKTTTTPFLLESDTALYLIYATSSEGGKGMLDLWAIKVNEDISPLAKPFNLSKINSYMNECCPFYDYEENCLYFSSQMFLNMGGYDIFKAYGSINKLSDPINLGYPLNTNFDEVFFNKYYRDSSFYFASNRNKNLSDICCNDLYKIPGSRKKDTMQFKKEIKYAESLIPIILYFDNDEPNPKTWDTTTNYSYDELYERYIQKKEEFVREYSKGLKKQEYENAIWEVMSFFNEEVEKNYYKLIEFLSLLKSLLESGRTIEITIKGYASPLNTSDYNLNLSKRRIKSFENFIRKYNNYYFSTFIDTGKLIIKREAFGENMVAQGVSDNLYDKRESVYSPKASKERKIAVIAVKID